MASSDLNINYRTIKKGTGGREAKAELDAFNKSAGASKLSLTDLKSGLDLAVQGFRMAQQFVRETVGPTMELAQQQRDLARAMGAPAEEAGVLIQIADDLNVSYDSLKTGMKKLNAEGIQPTWENILKLADEYQALPNSTAQAQFAAQRFGRAAGPELQKLLEKSTTELEQMAKGLEGSALIMSGEAVEAAEDLRLAQDELNDTWLESKVAIGTELIPAMVDLAVIAKELQPLLTTGAKGVSWSVTTYKSLGVAARIAATELAFLAGKIDYQTFLLEREALITGQLDTARRKFTDGGAAFKDALDAAGAGGERVSNAMRAAADNTIAFDDAQGAWAQGAALDAAGALQAAGAGAERYLAGLLVIDEILGTNQAANETEQRELQAIMDEFARTGDVAAMESALHRFYQEIEKAPEKMEPARQKAQDFNKELLGVEGNMKRMDGTKATVEFVTIHTTITNGVQQDSAKDSFHNEQQDSARDSRATGGPVWPGGTYLVGERGPEILEMPATMGGFVHNASDTRQMLAGGAVNNHYGPTGPVAIHIHPPASMNVEKLVDELERRLGAKADMRRRTGARG